MTRKIYKYITIALLGVTLAFMTGCEWLDVPPQAQVDLDKMYSKPEGYQNALLGVYTSMTGTSQYGQDMTYGFTDVIAQYYTMHNNESHEYHYISQLNYEHENSINKIKSIWLGSYNTIANTNVLLEQLNKTDADFFYDDDYRLIKGEALALRAYIHFDLFRMFAPNWEDAKDKLSIPYASSFSKQAHPQLKGSDFIDRVLSDLDSAYYYLDGIDPVQLDSYKSMSNHFNDVQVHGNVFNSFRGFRLNIYAVQALLARVNFYIGNNAKAFQEAEKVIALKEKGFFQFTSQREFEEPEANRNVLMSNELIFALDDATINNRWFGISASDNMAFKIQNFRSIYNRDTDFRIRLLSGDGTSSLKYARITGVNNAKIPMIRVSEMYLISAEAGFNTDKTTALNRLKELKDHRGVSQNLEGISFEDLQQEVLQEFRREFIGEGQLFYAYKRLKLDNINRGNNMLEMPLKNYTLPMPDVEIEFGNRDQP